MTRTRRLKRRTRGMAMVEMVFVLPLLILLVFAIAEFGLMFSRWLTLSNAVREGARAGVPWSANCGGETPSRADKVRTTVVNYARAGGVPLADDAFTVDGECDGVGSTLTVTASYDFKLNIPYGSLGKVPLGYSSKMRNEL